MQIGSSTYLLLLSHTLLGQVVTGRSKTCQRTRVACTTFPVVIARILQPGASHIYHIGSTGFFLDHGEHITLSSEQETELNQYKEQALLKQATFARQVEEAEQGLWVLTSSDTPDAANVDAQVRKIAKLQGDQRIAFIRAVGEAAKVLTVDQRKKLVGRHGGEQSMTGQGGTESMTTSPNE